MGQSLKTQVKQKSQGNTGQDLDLNPELTQRAPKSSQETMLIKVSWLAQHWARDRVSPCTWKIVLVILGYWN